MSNDTAISIFTGNLTRDPEFKEINGNSLVTFSIASNYSYKSNGTKKEEVSYFEFDAWGKLAEIIRDYAKKGNAVLINARPYQSTWDTPDGKKASKIKFRVETFRILNGRKPDQTPQSETANQQPSEPMYDSYEPTPEDLF